MARDKPMSPAEKRAVARVIQRGKDARRRDARREMGKYAAKLGPPAPKPKPSAFSDPENQRKLKLIKAGFGGGLTENLVTKAADNILEGAINMPAGVYEIGKAVAGDVDDASRKLGKRKGGDLDFDRSRKVGKAVVDSTVATVKHPLRRPGDTLLLGLGAISGGAGLVSRASAAGTAARVASKAGKGRTKAALVRPGHEGGSLLRRPAPEPRVLKMGDATVRSRYSGSAAVRGVQKGLDKATGHKGGITEAGQIRKFSREVGQNRKVTDAAERGPSLALARAGRKATGAQQMALRAWAEGAPVDAKIARHEKELKTAKGQRRRDLAYRVGLLKSSKKYVTERPEPKLGELKANTAGDVLVPARTVKNKKGRPGVQRENGWDAQAKKGDPDNPIYVYRDEKGETLGTLQVTLKDGKPVANQVVVLPQHRRKGVATKLYEAAGRDHDITPAIGRSGLTEDGAPFVNAVAGKPGSRVELADDFKRPRKYQGTRGLSPKAMQALTHRIDQVAGDAPGGRERVLRDMGLLDEEQIAFRKHAPGRQDLGARWATSAKETERRLTELKTGRKELLASAKDVEVPGQTVKTRRPRTEEEAKGRLEAIEQAVEPLIAQWTADLNRIEREERKGGEGAAVDKYEYWINRKGKTEGSKIAALPEEDRKLAGYVQGERKGYRDRRGELSSRDLAEEMLAQAAGQAPSRKIGVETILAVHKTLTDEGVNIAELRKALDERDELRGRFQDAEPTPDEVFSGAPAREPDFGTVTEKVDEPGYTIPGKLSDEDVGALAALDKLAEETERFGLEGLHGAEDFQGGRVRIPDVPNVRQRQPLGTQQFRGGVPKRPASLTKGYSGALRDSGNYRVKTTQLVAESGLEAQRYASVHRVRDTVLKAARDERPADTLRVQWMPVREKSQLSEKSRKQLRDVGERAEIDVPLTLEERRVAQNAWQEFVDDVFPENGLKTSGVGDKVPGVKWVPKQMLDGINRPIATGAWGASLAVLDTAMNLVKFGIIPLKPAYITANAAGNVTFNLVQQGVLMPANWKAAVSMLRHEELGPAARELIGSGAAQALLEGNTRGPLATTMTKTSDTMSQLMAEPMMRLSSLVHEGRRFGIKPNDHEAWLDLIQNPARRDDLAEITRRAKDAIIDYDRLGPIEKAVTRRAIFIYPWVKGATLYGGQFLMEHPVQSAVYNQAANVGREESDRDLGAKPSWAKGVFKVGGTDEMPLTVNPNNVSPFSQAAQVGYNALGAFTGRGGSAEQLGGMIHPAATAMLEAAFKRDLSTGAGKEGSFPKIVGESLLSDIAPSVYKANLDRADEPGQRTYPMTRNQAHLRFGLGAFMPRNTNRAVLNERAEEETERRLSPAVRARRDVGRERQSLFVKMQREDPHVLENGRLPKGIREAYNREAAVKAARAGVKREYDSGPEYQRHALIAEAKLAEKWGAVDKGFAAQAEEWAGSRAEDELSNARERLRYQALRPAYGDVTSRARKYLDE